jgi:acetate kinase
MSASTHIASELVVLALNSGSSSLKFGLYCVGPAKAGVLLTHEAEAIGGEGSQFHAEDPRNNARPVAIVMAACHLWAADREPG